MAESATQLECIIRRHGGRRDGAGRKAGGPRPNVAHRMRAPHDRHAPAHITLRTTALPVSLRNASVFQVVRSAIARASKTAFRIVAFSVQRDHVHLLIEGDDGAAVARGMQGLAIRIAKAVNRVLHRRGTVWADRYHLRDLTTPREVRNALVYVFQNHRKHGHAERIDPCSSARWFDGWRRGVTAIVTSSPVVTARTWLARWGWRRHGLLDPDEVPRGKRRQRSSGRASKR
jgi:putative transposase